MKKLKKALSFLLIFCLLISTLTTVMAADHVDVKVKLDGNYISFDTKPCLIGGRTMVPLRAIFEALGATVDWDDTTQTVTSYNEAYLVKCSIGKNEISVNNEIKIMDIAPMIVDGRTLVPARFIAEAFACTVEWDADNSTVNITSAVIDYSQLEKPTTQAPSASSDNSSSANGNKTNSETKYYYGTNIPTYTQITGISLKRTSQLDSGEIYYVYPYTKYGEYSEIVDYAGYFYAQEWIELEMDNKDTRYYSLAFYNPLTNENILMMLDFELDQVCILPSVN